LGFPGCPVQAEAFTQQKQLAKVALQRVVYVSQAGLACLGGLRWAGSVDLVGLARTAGQDILRVPVLTI